MDPAKIPEVVFSEEEVDVGPCIPRSHFLAKRGVSALSFLYGQGRIKGFGGLVARPGKFMAATTCPGLIKRWENQLPPKSCSFDKRRRKRKYKLSRWVVCILYLNGYNRWRGNAGRSALSTR